MTDVLPFNDLCLLFPAYRFTGLTYFYLARAGGVFSIRLMTSAAMCVIASDPARHGQVLPPGLLPLLRV